MGEVKTKIYLENASDIILKEEGYKKDVRALEVEALIDTGAMMMMLPQDIVEKLGLKKKGSAIVTYADERKEEREIAGIVKINIDGRAMESDCIVGPPFSEPLIGQIVLERLDLVVDCAKQALGPRPESPSLPLIKMKKFKIGGKKMKKLTSWILGVLLIAGAVSAAEKGETSAAFLKLTGGARPAGLGDCYIGLSDDVSACYFNPAGLTQIERKEGLFMLLRPMTKVDDLIMSFGGFALPLPYGAFGLSFTYYGYGEMDKITGEDNNGNPKKDGKWSAYDFALSSSFARKIKENLGLGGSLKVINGKIDDESAIAFAIDVGGLYNTPKEGLKIGVALKNLGSKMTYDNDPFGLPLSLKAGVSYRLSNIPLLILSDLTIPNDNNPYIGIGVEYKPRDIFSIRGGYKTGPSDEGSGLTIGLGTEYGAYNFDYAYQPYGKLGDSHRVSVLAKF